MCYVLAQRGKLVHIGALIVIRGSFHCHYFSFRNAFPTRSSRNYCYIISQCFLQCFLLCKKGNFLLSVFEMFFFFVFLFFFFEQNSAWRMTVKDHIRRAGQVESTLEASAWAISVSAAIPLLSMNASGVFLALLQSRLLRLPRHCKSLQEMLYILQSLRWLSFKSLGSLHLFGSVLKNPSRCSLGGKSPWGCHCWV